MTDYIFLSIAISLGVCFFTAAWFVYKHEGEK